MRAVPDFLLVGACYHQPIKNPLSCWNSEEQDRGDVPLPREVRVDNDMDTGDAFALLREKIQWLGIRVSPWGIPPFDYIQKRFSGFCGFYGFKGVGIHERWETCEPFEPSEPVSPMRLRK